MSSAMKVSQLNNTTIDGSEKFHVAKGGNDYAVSINDVKTFIGGDSGSLDIWDLATFQANANIVLPLGKRVYYKKSNGQITGIYKMSDGVTNIFNLPFFYDEWNYSEYQSNNFPSIAVNRHGWQYDYDNGKIYCGSDSDPQSSYTPSNTFISGQPFFILFPIQLNSYSIKIPSFTTSGTLDMALYYISSNGTLSSTSTMVPNSNASMTINSVGYNTVNLSTPITLEPGIYMHVWKKQSGTYSLQYYSINNCVFYDKVYRSINRLYNLYYSSSFPLTDLNSGGFVAALNQAYDITLNYTKII